LKERERNEWKEKRRKGQGVLDKDWKREKRLCVMRELNSCFFFHSYWKIENNNNNIIYREKRFDLIKYWKIIIIIIKNTQHKIFGRRRRRKNHNVKKY
jgi:hypothetical protein